MPLAILVIVVFDDGIEGDGAMSTKDEGTQLFFSLLDFIVNWRQISFSLTQQTSSNPFATARPRVVNA